MLSASPESHPALALRHLMGSTAESMRRDLEENRVEGAVWKKGLHTLVGEAGKWACRVGIAKAEEAGDK